MAPPGFVRGAIERLLASRTTHAESWNAIGVFAVRALSAALLFVSQIVIARWMGAAEYGLFVTAWTCVLVLGGIVHLGFNTAMMRLAPQYFANRNWAAFRGLWIGGRRIATLSATIVMLVGLAAVWLFETNESAALALPLALAFLCLPLYTRTDVQDGLGRGQGWTMDSIVPPFVVRPFATSSTRSYSLLPVSAIVSLPSSMVPAFRSAVSSILWKAGVLDITLMTGTIDMPKGVPSPVVKTTTCAPPATIPVTDGAS